MLDSIPTNLLAAASAHAEEAVETGTSAMSAAGPALSAIAQFGVGVLVVGILLCLYRMIRGPHLADRVLAGDTMAMLVAGLVILLALKYGTSLFYDAALVVSILGFASTVAFAQYIGARRKFSDDPVNTPDHPEPNAGASTPPAEAKP